MDTVVDVDVEYRNKYVVDAVAMVLAKITLVIKVKIIAILAETARIGEITARYLVISTTPL